MIDESEGRGLLAQGGVWVIDVKVGAGSERGRACWGEVMASDVMWAGSM